MRLAQSYFPVVGCEQPEFDLTLTGTELEMIGDMMVKGINLFTQEERRLFQKFIRLKLEVK